MAVISVAIVDDHPVMLKGLTDTLSREKDIRVAWAVGNGRAALSEVLKTPVDVVLVDYRLPDVSGIEVARRIHRECPQTRTILLTGDSAGLNLDEVARMGISGCALKTLAPNALTEMVRQVYQGKPFLDPELADRLFAAYSSLSRQTYATELGLSDSQIKLLKLSAEGLNYDQISKELHWSTATVKRQAAEVLSKLGASHRAHAVALAIQRGLI